MQADLNNLLAGANAGTAFANFALYLVLSAVLAFALSWVYVHFGRALSNRKLFAHNFILLAVTTTLVITIVKSSLALSLGLVGALSIVRFRAAIKEPEELAYLFLAISIGLGMGAGQPRITIAAFIIILLIIIITNKLRKESHPANFFLTVSGAPTGRITAAQIADLLGQCGLSASLQRLDEFPDNLEASFHLSSSEVGRLEEFNRRLRMLNEGLKISYVRDHNFGD
jgi:hypothetical protein